MKKLAAGSGEFQFERKYENPWTGPITFTIWLDGNSVPRANAEDGPLFSRWRVTPFRHQIMVVDPKWMDERVSKPEYRAAVLAWAVQGREAWLQDGIGTEPFIEKAVAEVQAGMDPLHDFWEQCVKFGEHTRKDRYFATTLELRQKLDEWHALRQESVKFRNCTRKPLFSNSPIAPICVYAWVHGHTNASTRVHTR